MKKCPGCNSQFDDAKIFCPNCGNQLETISIPQPPPPQPAPPQTMSTPPENTPLKKKRAKKKILIPILLAVSVVINIALGIILYFVNDERIYYEDECRDLRWDYWDLEKDYEFFDRFARVLPDDGSGKYHRYGCSQLDSDADFWIYNVELAQSKAIPCEKCCSDD